ncbi:uncharacterized protein LOC111133524 [Crassostrea virginica]
MYAYAAHLYLYTYIYVYETICVFRSNSIMDGTFLLKTIAFSVFFVTTTGLSDDEIMQAACAAVVPSSGLTWISAVRKPCSNTEKTDTCDIICKNAVCSMRSIYGNQGSSGGTCVAAYHLYTKRNTLKDGENGKASIATLRYGVSGCRNPWCGPNFCCCKA